MNKKNIKKRKRFSKRKRKIFQGIFFIALVILSAILIGYQAFTDIRAKNWIGGENYQGLPVDATLQLIVLSVVLVAAVISLWEFFFKKKKNK